MEKLFDGVKKFNKNKYKENKNLFGKLSDNQDPHTLFITCSDSRVIPNMLTTSKPGELFIIRNIANIVPPYDKSYEYLSTTSSIEYAVNVLKVRNIVICGHSNCGGCKALYMEEKPKNISHTKEWIELLKPLKSRVKKIQSNKTIDDKFKLVEKQNIILQIENLLTYPCIKKKFENDELNIYGWYFEIPTGNIYNYDMNSKDFELII